MTQVTAITCRALNLPEFGKFRSGREMSMTAMSCVLLEDQIVI